MEQTKLLLILKLQDRTFIKTLIKHFGSQSIIASIDYKTIEEKNMYLLMMVKQN